jgi:class 3 adenylate cyclase
MSAYKSQTIDSTVGDAIAEAFGELQSLRDEMRETADNMESGGMGHMDKAQNAAAAADMERVVESLRLSATQLRNGVNIGVAANTHVIAMNFLHGHPIRCYRSTFKD